MSSDGDIYVYTGRWKDYSQGNVLGDRFTMSSKNALVLIAFISIFDGLVGSVVWNSLCYYVHQWRATTNEPRDGLYHQHQTLLRNNADALSFARQATKVGWTWRKRAPQGTFRGIKLSLIAVFVSVFFSAAALLSSLIASSGDVLLRNHRCGYVQPPTDLTAVAGATLQNAENQESAGIAHEGLTYAQDCYNNTIQNQVTATNKIYSPLGACNLYTKPTLPWNVTMSNPCPFGNACSVPDSEIIKLDTGLLNSLDDLGINQPQENRVLWRRVETCSPLVTTGYSNNSFYNVSEANGISMPMELSLAATYDYGLNLAVPSSIYQYNLSRHNYTFEYDYASYIAADLAYSFQVASGVFNVPGFPSFWPKPELVQNSDSIYYPLSMFFLANRVLFPEGAVEDPWFLATHHDTSDADVQEQEIYSSTDPGHVLACLEQAQICNPNSPGGPACTELNDWANLINNYEYDGNQQLLIDEFNRIGLNDMQFTTAANILTNLQNTAFASMVDLLGQECLQAYRVLEGGSQLESGTLPANQWQVEMDNWFGISLATMQQLQLYGVTGPTDPDLLSYLQPYPANDTVDASLCASQKVRSSAYQSFSVLGITINFVVGGLILLAGIINRECLFQTKTLRRKTWNADGALQLQRMAYERLELGGEWEGEGTVPMTKKGMLFATPLVGEAKKMVRHESSGEGLEKERLPGSEGSEGVKKPVMRETSEYSSLMTRGDE